MDRACYVHTFNCGLYLIRGVERDEPRAKFVHGFPGKDSGVPVLTSHYWLQTAVHACRSAKAVEQRFPAFIPRVIRAFEPSLRRSAAWPGVLNRMNHA